MRAKILGAIALLFAIFQISANESGNIPASTDSVGHHGFLHRGIIGKVIDYFDKTNDVDEAKPVDVSFIGGPHYSSDSGFGLGVVASMSYKADTADIVTPRSIASIKVDATTAAHFEIKADGYHIFKSDRSRLIYDVNLASISDKFWGIGYDECSNDDNESKYKYLSSEARAAYVIRLAKGMYIGPMLALDYYDGRNFAKPELLHGQDERTFNWGPGISFQYDTRDCITAAEKGVYIRLDQRFMPKFLGNEYAFSMTELTVSGYVSVWKGGVLAMMAHGRATYGNVPWGMMSKVGGSHYMRGYFEGRYRDKGEIDICAELRQHVWRRSGIVVWVGGGCIFPKFSGIRLGELLTNYGIGYRWEFKHRVNVRLDLGFGRHQRGIMFNINEAF